MRPKLLPIVSAWLGDNLTYLEKLCLTSMVNTGHEVYLYSYNDIKGVPSGVKIREASEIMARDEFISYRNGSYALGSNIFRYKILHQQPCIWVDTDMFLLKAIQPSDGYVFGWEDDLYINTAVLSLPSESEILSDIRDLLSQDPFFAPWWTEDQKELQDEACRQGAHLSLADLPWATTGPKLVTHYARKNNVSRYASPPQTFYPIHWQDFKLPFVAGDPVGHALTEESVGVHFWNHMLGDIKDSPQRGSFVWQQCERLDIRI